MNGTPTSPCKSRTCIIVTLYEDFASAIRGYQIFDWLEQNFGNDMPVTAASWSFHMLGMSRVAAAMLQDSDSADVLVVSANGDKALPPHVAVWVDRFMSRERNAEPVLVALAEAGIEAHGSAMGFNSSLQEIATRRHARFLCNGDLKEQLSHHFPAELASDPLRGPVRETLGRPALRAPQRCGINE